jgi:stage V sporulation protein AD
VLIDKSGKAPFVRAITVGTIEDKGITDQNNMGAAMAPAAAKTLLQFFSDTGMNPSQFDAIVTGDLGLVGSRLLYELCDAEGIDIRSKHTDCGLLLFDRERQDVHAGGSGCGCSAVVLASYLLPKLERGELREILVIGTGAMMSPASIQQGQAIPAIAHLIALSSEQGGEI